MREINIDIPPAYLNYIYDWNYEKYVLVGGYGSGKSYETALKIILKLLKEKRKCLIVRDVAETLRESCWDLIYEILDSMDLVTEETAKKRRIGKVYAKRSPLGFEFPNGSRIIFRGMDKPSKAKSINGVSIVWIEEASEISVEAYKELLGRLRIPDVSMHYILTTNPVGKDNWVYNMFFVRMNEDGTKTIILDDEKLYKKKVMVNAKTNTYYLHSTPDDNVFLPDAYIKRLDELSEYDPDLYRIARLGHFGVNGIKVLPNFVVADNAKEFKAKIKSIDDNYKRIGMDFGFEISFNAVVKMAIDDKEKILYIYDEYYKNKKTDPETARDLKEWDINIKNQTIRADSAEPKTIRYYVLSGFNMVGAKKGQGSRLENVKKCRRFKKIVCSPKCKNTIRELKDLVYAKDRDGNIIYDEFNIDPHTFSAIWYGLDGYEVADIKKRKSNTNNSKTA